MRPSDFIINYRVQQFGVWAESHWVRQRRMVPCGRSLNKHQRPTNVQILQKRRFQVKRSLWDDNFLELRESPGFGTKRMKPFSKEVGNIPRARGRSREMRSSCRTRIFRIIDENHPAWAVWTLKQCLVWRSSLLIMTERRRDWWHERAKFSLIGRTHRSRDMQIRGKLGVRKFREESGWLTVGAK